MRFSKKILSWLSAEVSQAQEESQYDHPTPIRIHKCQEILSLVFETVNLPAGHPKPGASINGNNTCWFFNDKIPDITR